MEEGAIGDRSTEGQDQLDCELDTGTLGKSKEEDETGKTCSED